jgi:hypothetical protein
MGAADERVSQLLDRWLTSVELHARYLALDDGAYARLQAWPRHERPSRWVLDLARTRLLEVRRLLGERQARGDEGFAEALELMAFLTSLLGSEHVERFIPLARPPDVARPRGRPALPETEPADQTPVRQSPKPAAARRTEPRTSAATRATRARAVPSRRQSAPAPQAATPSGAAAAASDKVTATVIADAARLISWGREWPQLAGLIARLADRPAEAEVWKILRSHRAQIEATARRPRD